MFSVDQEGSSLWGWETAVVLTTDFFILNPLLGNMFVMFSSSSLVP